MIAFIVYMSTVNLYISCQYYNASLPFALQQAAYELYFIIL